MATVASQGVNMIGTDLEFAFLELCLKKPDLWTSGFKPIDPLVRWVFDCVQQYRGEFHQYPNKATLLEYIKPSVEVQQFEFIESGLNPALDTKFVEKKVIQYIEEHALRQAIHECQEYLDSGKIKEAKSRLFDGVRAGAAPPFNYFKQSCMVTSSEPVPTGLYPLDQALNGGLRRKKMGLVCGPRSSGKSLILLNFAIGALYHGLTAFHVTIEDSLESTKTRYDMRLKGFGDRPVEKVKELYRGDLFIKEFISGEATMADIDAHMTIRPDVVLIDYLDEVKPSRNYNSRKYELGDVARGARALAQRHNCAVWIAKQTGRGTKFSDITTSEDSFEGYEPVQVADVSVVVNQTLDEKKAGQVRLVVDKNKDGKDGIPVKLDIDYSRMLLRVPRHGS